MKKQLSKTLLFQTSPTRFYFIAWTSALLLMLLYTSCKKPDLKAEQEKLAMQSMSGEPLSINMSDIYAKLPLTILHNTGSVFKLNEEETQWLYKGDSLVVRVPVSVPGNAYLYAVKTSRAPKETHVYLVQINRSSGSSEERFTGTQEWIDLQTWNTYGLAFENGVAVKNRKVATDLGGHWERCMLEQGYFYMEPDSTIAARESVSGQSAVVTMDDPYDCANNINGTGKTLWTRIGNIFRGAANLIVTSTPYEYGSGSGGGGGGWIWPINWNQPGGLPGGVGGGPVNGIGTPANSDVALIKGALLLSDLEVLWLNQHLDIADEMEFFLVQDYINCSCGLTQPNRKGIIRDHLTMMMQNPDYVTKINNLTGNWWDRDQNGMVEARKIQMELYLQANPYGMIDCNDINVLPMNTFQEVGSYQVPAIVQNRINFIRNAHPNYYTNNNFRIKDINSATGGVVNCDYFYIKINSLPYLNNTQMTAPEFLEYFRTHINSFIINLPPNTSVSFEPYHHFVSGSIDVDETLIFNSPYESSLGAMIHIDMLVDGSIVESGYTRNTITDHYHFTVTTMKTPLDGNHPVSGNRRWGIFKSDGAYYFYICGVDRTNDMMTTFANWANNSAFNGADDLWHGVQSGILDFYDTHQGDAVSAEEKIARPRWSDVKEFLKGKMTLQQLKTLLHCP